MLQTRKSIQSQLENGLRLCGRQMIFAVDQAIVTFEVIGPAGRITSALKHGAHIARQPGSSHQSVSRIRRSGRCFYQLNNFIDIRKRYG